MRKPAAYLILDIGTGNIRAAVVTPGEQLLGIARADIRYYRDDLYPESIFFKPAELLSQLHGLCAEALAQAGDTKIIGVTSTSQREGIVLISRNEKAIIGLPNIDHRGREWEDHFAEKSKVYKISGRYPGSLFSAYKLIGIRERRPEIWSELAQFLSISDWVNWELTGKAFYEHSQASETLLYDVALGNWSSELCDHFGISASLLPPLAQSGTIEGVLKKAIASQWQLPEGTPVITGGGDTQLAIKSTRPQSGDMIIVSGTTTPVVKLERTYIVDDLERTWTSRDIVKRRFVFEANAGVTGLNYQRLKEVFYPNESYDIIEQELEKNACKNCVASLGSLIAGEKKPLTVGGFIFPVPVAHELTRGSFAWATLMDIAFSIAENYKLLAEIAGHDAGYIWACGGGLQSETLRKMIAAITGKAIRVRENFIQASVIGAVLLCNEALGRETKDTTAAFTESKIDQAGSTLYLNYYKNWKETRARFSTNS